ncbi:hypothetical protein ACRE_067640 [Hapsidospora chrysogenum ATCC 11550]|uniref:Uncharacterized protein n=1 Tax=Hapsidospora chrysogenum (strain ATCC 11550 / CBS 779.69 / DSM 880 / IAM 14645 / JCM 23072 / IMI 49137) TaxID=857340 RepID=A0A086SZH7_HAPC1|nr:hypothetical protein ACRE_067640 [Hapsidospora chrysogenum ATCC 11550]
MATPQAVLSPSQGISPKTVVANPKDSSNKEYFEAGGSTTSAKTDDSIDSSDFKSDNFSDSTTGAVKASDAPSCGGTEEKKDDGLKRKSSVSIQLPRNPSLPQGKEKRINRPRLRNASPQPTR